jgi:large subunit ribosomal protein L17
MTRKFRKSIDTEKNMLRNLASSVFIYEKVVTTEAKAKKVKSIVERLITRAKKGTLADHRHIFAYLPQEEAAKKLIENIVKRYTDRNGGYTRVIKIGNRKGDAAPQAEISLV